ncbi:hypothetical protein [Allopusillimonas soli]|nr:hypothetical protein [Allopusillimonas soli]
MTDTSDTLWIKNPLACSDPEAAGGVLVAIPPRSTSLYFPG